MTLRLFFPFPPGETGPSLLQMSLVSGTLLTVDTNFSEAMKKARGEEKNTS